MKEGREDGEYKEWYSNGQLMRQCYYKEGKEECVYKEWDEEGSLIVYKIYANGEVVQELLSLE